MSDWQLPDEIRWRCESVRTVGELDAFWDATHSPLDQASLRSLVRLARNMQPPPDYAVLPVGFDRSTLLRLPLRPRTMNALRRFGLLEGQDELTAGELMSLRNFGITSLLDVMCVTEPTLGRQSLPTLRPERRLGNDASVRTNGSWEYFVDLLAALFGAAREFRGADTVGEALRMDLTHLASAVGIGQALESLEIRNLTGGHPIADVVRERLAKILASTSDVERIVIERRLFVANPPTLRETGHEAGLSGERVRQVQRRLQATIDEAVGREMATASVLLAERLGPVVPASDLESVVFDAFDGASSNAAADDLARRMLRAALGYSCVDGICLDQAAREAVASLREAAREIADDVGLVDEGELLDRLPSAGWNDFFPQLLRCCEFQQIGERLALRATAQARAKAALLDIGRPATKEEIAEVSGLNPDRVGGQLSAIASVARADKLRWGLAEWIDDVYEGIPAEIIQRIEEDGGATSVDRLVDELPQRFGVSEGSVRSYISTPQFTLRDGYVSLADHSTIMLRELNDVIDGRDDDGDPYWAFAVEHRYFDGYSLTGFPPELARELGCEPNGKIRIQLDHPTGCRQISIVWRLASSTGASMGYLAEPLRRLGAQGGDRIRVVLKPDGTVGLHRDNSADWPANATDASAVALLERIKNRRKFV